MIKEYHVHDGNDRETQCKRGLQPGKETEEGKYKRKESKR